MVDAEFFASRWTPFTAGYMGFYTHVIKDCCYSLMSPGLVDKEYAYVFNLAIMWYLLLLLAKSVLGQVTALAEPLMHEIIMW